MWKQEGPGWIGTKGKLGHSFKGMAITARVQRRKALLSLRSLSFYFLTLIDFFLIQTLGVEWFGPHRQALGNRWWRWRWWSRRHPFPISITLGKISQFSTFPTHSLLDFTNFLLPSNTFSLLRLKLCHLEFESNPFLFLYLILKRNRVLIRKVSKF